MNVELVIFESPKTFRATRLNHYKHDVITKNGKEIWDGNQMLLKKSVGGLLDRFFWKDKPGSYDLKTGRNVVQQVMIKSPDPIALKGWVPNKITTIGEMPEFVMHAISKLGDDIEVINVK